jgi:hypothetical protein
MKNEGRRRQIPAPGGQAANLRPGVQKPNKSGAGYSIGERRNEKRHAVQQVILDGQRANG